MLALVIDDHPITRDGLVAMVSGMDDVKAVSEAGSFSEAWDSIIETKPELILMDLRLGDRDSIDLIGCARQENKAVKILVVSMCEEGTFAPRVMKAGANGFISKSQTPDEITNAIHKVMDGRSYLSENMIEQIISPQNFGKTGILEGIDTLTNRELEVMRLIGQGMSTRRIAEKLTIAARTVESHKDHIKRKMNLADAAELAKQAALWLAEEHTPG